MIPFLIAISLFLQASALECQKDVAAKLPLVKPEIYFEYYKYVPKLEKYIKLYYRGPQSVEGVACTKFYWASKNDRAEQVYYQDGAESKYSFSDGVPAAFVCIAADSDHVPKQYPDTAYQCSITQKKSEIGKFLPTCVALSNC